MNEQNHMPEWMAREHRQAALARTRENAIKFWWMSLKDETRKQRWSSGPTESELAPFLRIAQRLEKGETL